MNQSDHGAIEADTLKSLRTLETRINEVEQIFNAEDALATLDYVNSNLGNLRKLPTEELIGEIAKYSHSSPGRLVDFGSLNEAAIVLLSAYLEGFLEELHEEVTFHLLQERVESAGVLKALLDYAHGRFSNPRANQITSLFNTLSVKGVISKLPPDIGARKIDTFVKTRNRIAHGEHVRVSGNDILAWIEFIRKFAAGLTSEVLNEVNSKIRPTQ